MKTMSFGMMANTADDLTLLSETANGVLTQVELVQGIAMDLVGTSAWESILSLIKSDIAVSSYLELSRINPLV